jgi:hypothetical protein
MRNSKVFWIFSLVCLLIGFMGSHSLLMANPSVSHATHFFSEKGPLLPHNESGCYVCHADGHDQCVGQPLFRDGLPLGATNVCDNCHSPDGAFPGGNPSTSLLDPTIGAKANWDEGVYDSGGEMLKAGKEKWCVTCHDDVPANSDWDGSGINAPDISLYYTSGHGRPDAGVECLVCHDATFTHIDGEPRTYAFSDEDVDPADGIPDIYAFANSGVAYAAGYRLRYVNGEVPIMVPVEDRYTYGSTQVGLITTTAYRRCFDSGCHDSYRVFGWDSLENGITSYTNFRSSPPDPPRSYGGGSENTNFHVRHKTYASWDSDWDVNTDTYPDVAYGHDSMFTCSSCHNVHGAAGIHGSTNEPMIRDGSLAGRAGYGFSYLIEDPVLGYPYVTSEGATRANSVGAVFRNGADEMCGGCHAGGNDTPPDSSYYTAPTITYYEGIHTGSTSDNTLKVDGNPWIEGELLGKYVKNITDGGYDTEIIGNTSNTVTVEELWGGTDDLWEPGDEARIYEYANQFYMEYFRTSQDCSFTVDIVWTYHSKGAGWLPGGGDPDYSSLSVWEDDTDIDITAANDVVVISHSGLTGAIASGDTVTGANSGATGVIVGVATNTQICIDITSGHFESGEQIYKDQDNYVESTSPPRHVGVMYLDCYDGPHVDRVTLADATTDSLHYRCIRSASDCATPFAGKRETGAYFQWNDNNHLFKLNEDCARVERIGATLNYTSDDTKVIFDMPGNCTKAIGCIAYDSTNMGNGSVNGFALNGNNTIAANCIAHDIEGHGFVLYGLTYLNYYFACNCVAIDNGGQGFKQSYTSGETYVWNCVASNNAGGDFSSTVDQYNYEYNMSSDDTAPGGTSKTNKDFTSMWVDETQGSEDYHLSETGVVDSDFQGGVNPEMFYPYIEYILIDDIDGEPRSIWYRGADESGPPGRDYAFSTISGLVGILDGVTMNGLPGSPVTGQGGFYAAVAGLGWSGTVTPEKVGYTFNPASRAYSSVTEDQMNQDYTPTVNTYTISGCVGVDGVTMSGLPGNPVTSGGGFYSATVYHEAYVYVIPTKPGYRFDPSYRQYYAVTSDQANQDYTPIVTHIISGYVGNVERVYMQGLNPTGDVYTNADGFYFRAVDDGWSGTVTPRKVGYIIDPTSRQYSNVTSDQTNQDYAPTEASYIISGSVGTLDGVIMDGLPGNPVTSGGGLYSATVGHGWSGYVTPMKVGYNFNPEKRYHSSMTSDKTNQNFTPNVNTYIISGSVGTLDGVTMSGLPGNPVTSGGGFYSATVDWGWSAAVTPTKAGYTFEPTNRLYSYVTYDQENQDYTPDSTPIIHESFEGSGYEEGFTETVGTGCTLDEDSTIPGTPPIDFGSQCLKSVSNATGYEAKADLLYSTEQAKTFTTFYVYIESEDLAADGSYKDIATLYDSNASEGLTFRLYKGGQANLKFKFRLKNNGSTSLVYTSTALTLNTWYKIGIKYDDTDNTYEFTIDDSTVSSGSLTGVHATGIKQWRLGFFDGSDAETGVIYFDELTVSTESFD